ncbi:MAG: hypothetical protein WCL18_05345 [bacterium]
MVPLRKAKYNQPHIAAILNPINEGKNKIHTADNTLHIEPHTNDFFLHVVSANTDVGISKSQTVSVDTLLSKIISAMESHVYV